MTPWLWIGGAPTHLLAAWRPSSSRLLSRRLSAGAGGYRRVVVSGRPGGASGDMQWDYSLAYSWMIGRELADPFYSSKPDRYAPWGHARVVVLFPNMCAHPRNAHRPRLGVAKQVPPRCPADSRRRAGRSRRCSASRTGRCRSRAMCAPPSSSSTLLPTCSARPTSWTGSTTPSTPCCRPEPSAVQNNQKTRAGGVRWFNGQRCCCPKARHRALTSPRVSDTDSVRTTQNNSHQKERTRRTKKKRRTQKSNARKRRRRQRKRPTSSLRSRSRGKHQAANKH